MAQAVQQLFPDAKLGIGPPIENGFYYDFDVETPFVPEDLDTIETAMRKIIKEGQRFSRRPVADGDALDELKDEPYKLELIGLKGSGHADEAAEGANVEVGAGELTIYDNLRRDGELAWKDLCRGPAPADHQADPGVQADAHARRRTGAATRRTSSCSASTAPPGRARTRSRRTSTSSRRPRSATTASSVASSTCSPSRRSSAPASSSSIRRAA